MKRFATKAGYAALLSAAVFGIRSSYAADLLVTEAMPNPTGTDADREWFEIYNAGVTPLDISGFAAGDGLVSTNLSTGEGMGVFPAGTMIQPGQFMIIALRAGGFASFTQTTFPHAKADFEFTNGVPNPTPPPTFNTTVADDPNTPNMPQKSGWGAANASLGIANGTDDVGIIDASGTLVDMFNYNTTGVGVMVTYTDNSNATMQRRPANQDTDSSADWQYVTGASNGLANSTPGFGRRLFWDIDGSGTAGGGGATPSGLWDGTTANFNTDAAGAGTTTLATTSTLDKVTFTAGTDGSGAFTVDVSGTQIATILDIARGDVTFNGGTIATGSVNVATGAVTTINSVVAGGVTGKLAKSGAGTLTLTGANTYANGTSVDGGTLNANSASALGAATGPLAVNNPTVGAGTAVTLNLFAGGATSVGSLSGTTAVPSSGTNTATINNPVGLSVTQSADGSFDGTIAGAGGLTKTGAAQLALSGTNTYTGGTAVNAGTLKAVKPVSLSEYATAGMVSVASGATLALSTGPSNWSDTAINDAYTAATFAADSKLALDTSSGDFTYGLAMGKANGLTKQGINKLTLTAASTYTGGTTIADGSLQLGDGGSTGSITGNIANNAALIVNRSDAALVLSGNISGTGSVTNAGAGSVTLSGVNTHAGGTTVSAGTLVAGNADALAGGAVTVADSALARAQPGLPKAVTVTTLATNVTGKFDLTNNSMVVKGMTDAQVRGLILGSYNAGAWNGPTGLTSSTAAAATVGTTGIGYALNSNLGTLTEFKGVTGLSGADVLVRYTYYGDADLDGDVDGNDVGSWAGNFTGSGGSTTKTWDQGDWDYDGDVDGNDVGLWAGNFTGSGGGILNLPNAQPGAVAALEAMGFTVVPEPASLSALALAGLALGRRRRKSVTA